VTFKPIPHRLYGDETDAIEPNVLVVKIQPDEGIALRFEAKVRAQTAHSKRLYGLQLRHGFGVQSPPAYERLLADAMRGDQTLFTRWTQSSAPGRSSRRFRKNGRTRRTSAPELRRREPRPQSAFELFPDWRKL